MRIRTSRRALTSLVMAAMITVIAAGAATAQDAVSSVKRLPPNVQAMIRIPSVQVMKDRMDESLMGEMMGDSAFADMREQIVDKIDELSESMESEVGVPLADLLTIPSGELVFAVMPASGNKIGLVAMMDFGESSDVVDQLIEKAVAAAEDEGAEVSTETVEGVQVTVIENADVPDGQVAYCIQDSTLVVSSSVGIIEGVLVRWDGEDDRSFASNEVYSYIAERCATGHDEPVLEWFVDPISLLTSAMKAGGEANLQVQMVMSFLPSLGVNNLRGMGGAFDMATSEYDSINMAMIYVDQPATGVMGLMQFPSDKIEPPKWVPENASTYFCFNWDVATAYDSTEKLVDMFQGTGALSTIIDRMAEEPNGPKLHIKDDVIDNLSGRIEVFTDVSDPDTPGSERFCVAFGLKDGGDKMADVMDRISNTAGFPGEVRQFQGNTIYELPMPAGPGGAPQTMGMSAVKGHMFLTSHVELMEQIIRDDRPALVESSDYKRVVSYCPKEVSVIGFQKSDTQVQALYEMLRSGSLNGLAEGIDFTGLPPFDAMKKYLAPTGTYAIPDERGAVLVQFGLKPE